MKFYRYKWSEYASLDSFGEFTMTNQYIPNIRLELITFSLVSETPKGYWIGFDSKHKYKWISKTAKKRHAYPSKEQALNNFILRTKKRIKILEKQIRCCKISLGYAENITLDRL